MKISALIDKIRSLNNDTLAAPDQRWDTPTYLLWVQDFFGVLLAEAAEAFMDANGAITPAADFSALTTDSEFTASGADALYLTPCIEYVLWKYFSSDSAGTRNDAKAKEHLAAYRTWFTPQA